MKRHIPNSITCCNLICGCVAVFFAFRSQLFPAFLFIIAGAVFDFFDGFAARLLKVSSNIGKELDSLADDITFGLAPATIVFSMLSTLCPFTTDIFQPHPLCFAAFLIAAFSALRLAKFNLDERQSSGFIGLPTPANALFWGALANSFFQAEAERSLTVFLFLLAGVLISCFLLVSEIPMFALKFKQFGWKGNKLRYSFILVSAALLVLLGWGGFVLIIPLYILVSLVNNWHMSCKED